MTERDTDLESNPGGFTRRSMITGSAGVAVTVLAPTAAAAASRSGTAPVRLAKPGTRIEDNPVVAYVHHAGRGEVTVIHGDVERTYRDPALAKRLLAAARRSKEAR